MQQPEELVALRELLRERSQLPVGLAAPSSQEQDTFIGAECVLDDTAVPLPPAIEARTNAASQSFDHGKLPPREGFPETTSNICIDDKWWW